MLKNYLKKIKGFSDKQIGTTLQELSRGYLMKSELHELNIKDSDLIEFDDIVSLVELNTQLIEKRAVLAIIQTENGYFRVNSHYGTNKNMIVRSGTMDRGLVVELVRSILKGFNRERISPLNIDIFTSDFKKDIKRELIEIYT